jgi:LPS-assembly lipoprotein
MSWYRNRRNFLTAASGAALWLVSGCGFRPLYGAKSRGAVSTELARVKIGTIPNRIGQQLHNYLLDRINREGRPEKPLYLLSVDVEVEKVRQAVEANETATRVKLVFTAIFKLQEIATEKVLLKNWSRSVNSYNIVTSAMATRSAELDATDRAAREVSEEIRSLLALYFQRRKAEAEG